ncbi:MAG: hypothetical protein O2942_09440 [Proteobacteria bacterium]|nr:hypothetical protein [Pseudomonadota bacterium]
MSKESKDQIIRPSSTSLFREDNGIPHKLYDGLLEDNPGMRIEPLDKHGNFKLVDKVNEGKFITFASKEQNGSHNTEKYRINVEQFDGELQLRDFASASPKGCLIPMKITVQKGELDLEASYRDNTTGRSPPVSIVDKNDRFGMAMGFLAPYTHHTECSMERGHKATTMAEESKGMEPTGEAKMQPTASMGKMFASAMLMKSFEKLEDRLDTRLEAIGSHAKQEFLAANDATTLMDVPIAKTIGFLEDRGMGAEAGRLQKVNDFIGQMQPSDELKDVEHKGAIERRNNITPRSLVNQTANLSESMAWKNKDGVAFYDEWNKDEATEFSTETILAHTPGNLSQNIIDFNGVEQVPYRNGNLVVAGEVAKAIWEGDSPSLQEILTEVAPGAHIITKRSDLQGLDYAESKYTNGKKDFNTGIPTDAGGAAGNYIASPEVVAQFSQDYIGAGLSDSTLFQRAEYQNLMTNVISDAAKHPSVDQTPYELGLMCIALDKSDPRREDGYTHMVGHDGDTPNIYTDAFTLVGIDEDDRISKVGATKVNMSVRDSRSFEDFNQKVMEQKQVKQLDALDLATMAPVSGEVESIAASLGAEMSMKPPLGLNEESMEELNEIKGGLQKLMEKNPKEKTHTQKMADMNLKSPGGAREI